MSAAQGPLGAPGAPAAAQGGHAHAAPHAAHGSHVGGAAAPPTEFHLPHGSWWPFWLANAIALFAVGMVVLGRALNIGGGTSTVPVPLGAALLGLGVVAIVGTLLGWFVQDFKWWNSNTGTGLSIPKAGTLLFIGSEIFLFGALFATYFTFKNMSATWPDDPHIELPLLKTAVFTLFLFSSSYTIHKAEGHLKRGHHKAFRNWWLLTIVLGLVFLGGQVNEYMNLLKEGHGLTGSRFMGSFYMLTGTHGLHVFGGLCALTVVWVRAMKGQFDAERHAFPQAASMYWHFVDIVWVVVFSVIYLMNFL